MMMMMDERTGDLMLMQYTIIDMHEQTDRQTDRRRDRDSNNATVQDAMCPSMTLAMQWQVFSSASDKHQFLTFLSVLFVMPHLQSGIVFLKLLFLI